MVSLDTNGGDNWFGLTDEQVPYTNADRTEIDVSAIQNPRG
jgi:hypothetical protein